MPHFHVKVLLPPRGKERCAASLSLLAPSWKRADITPKVHGSSLPASARIRRMPCRVQVDRQLQEGILDLDATARRQIGDFLLALQEDPLPRERQALARKISTPAYFIQLPCGFHVSWEIVG